MVRLSRDYSEDISVNQKPFKIKYIRTLNEVLAT